MLKGHLTEEQIAQCVDAIIDGTYHSLDIALREHLASCDDCAAEALSVTDIAIDLKEFPKKKSLPTIKYFYYPLMGIAAVGLLFFIINGFFDLGKNKSDIGSTVAVLDTFSLQENSNKFQSIENEFVVIDSDKIESKYLSTDNKVIEGAQNEIKIIKKDILAKAYIPDETLEILFTNYTQAYRGEDITIRSKGVITVPATDSLKWSNPNSEELYVEFFNNKGERIFTLTKKTAGIEIPNLDKGLYYWKLINQEFDLLFVGKIFVE